MRLRKRKILAFDIGREITLLGSAKGARTVRPISMAQIGNQGFRVQSNQVVPMKELLLDTRKKHAAES